MSLWRWWLRHTAAAALIFFALSSMCSSLDQYMPWFTGTLHFVHQNVPCWLNVDHPRLNLVHHREFFTDQDNTLPTFSSDAIEAHLHRIPGIQKRFILINDDFFFGRNVKLSDFVLTNGDPVLYVSTHRHQCGAGGTLCIVDVVVHCARCAAGTLKSTQ